MARANPGARPYREMLGEVVLKHFEGHGTFMGTIIEYDEQTGFRIQVTRAPPLSRVLVGRSVPSCLRSPCLACVLSFHRAPTSGSSSTTATRRTSACATSATSSR